LLTQPVKQPGGRKLETPPDRSGKPPRSASVTLGRGGLDEALGEGTKATFWNTLGSDGEAEFPAILFDGIVGRRVAAYLVDLILLGVIWWALAAAASILGLITFGLTVPLTALALALVPLAYHTLTIGGPWSATPGMRLLGLQVRTLGGQRPDFGRAAIQTVVFYVTVGATSWLVLLLALFNNRGRTLHDFLSGLVVLRLMPAPD
ncbi:MAG: RDD family protein, partial [Alphaproteobacteria bacterium]|nr:RDD family protein [Alphaproteobacteria bacterium]